MNTITITNTIKKTNKEIKHLVISGGGISVFKLIGCLDVLFKENYFILSQIQSIYGTSAGAVIGITLALGFDWDIVVDYFIKRPWKDVININIQNILDSYSKRGLFDHKLLETIFKPLFDAKDISLSITMKEFYELTKIDLHFYSLELNRYKIEDISHSTHSNLSLITALQMTSCLPVFISPVIIDGNCYVDAGCIANYPLDYCIQKYNEPDAVLGFKNMYDHDDNKKNDTASDSTIFEYLLHLMYKILWNVSTENKQPKIKHEVQLLKMQPNTLSTIQKAIQEEAERTILLQQGHESATVFLSSSNPITTE